jgi:hypothetical protein
VIHFSRTVHCHSLASLRSRHNRIKPTNFSTITMTTAASRSMSRGRSSKFNLRSVVIPCVLLLMQNLIGRAVAMTTTQQQELVDIHNALRRGEGSSNMQIMVSTCDVFLQIATQIRNLQTGTIMCQKHVEFGIHRRDVLESVKGSMKWRGRKVLHK